MYPLLSFSSTLSLSLSLLRKNYLMEPFVTIASIADVLESLLSTSLTDLNFAIHVLDLDLDLDSSINRSVKILLGHHDV